MPMKEQLRGRKITARMAPRKKKPYQSWKMPFSGKDRKNMMEAKLNTSRGIGIFFGMKF